MDGVEQVKNKLGVEIVHSNHAVKNLIIEKCFVGKMETMLD